MASPNSCESFPCTELAGGAAVELFQGAPVEEESPVLLQLKAPQDLELPPDAPLTPCDPAAASPSTAAVLR
jgi:hypothetical protein